MTRSVVRGMVLGAVVLAGLSLVSGLWQLPTALGYLVLALLTAIGVALVLPLYRRWSAHLEQLDRH